MCQLVSYLSSKAVVTIYLHNILGSCYECSIIYKYVMQVKVF
jgi:hypothetical protein